MRERIEENMEQFKSMQLPIEDEEVVELLNSKYDELDDVFAKFQKKTYDQWKAKVEESGSGWLEQFIFRRTEEDQNIFANFRSEVTYLKLLINQYVLQLYQMLYYSYDFSSTAQWKK